MKEIPNFNYIDQLAEGDMKYKKKIIILLREELTKEITAYIASCERDNLYSASEFVHKIKHKISILGLLKGYELAHAHENSLKNNDTRDHQAFMGLLDQIIIFLNNHKST